jgi:hypothetical protein
MGIYINKGNEEFRSALRGEYVDKSGLIAVVNNTLLSRQRFSCVTRSRRFGKSLAAMMLYAYGEQFVFIIDEWDAICREALGNEAAMEKYVKLLRRLFKGGNSQRVFAAVYMTGILPNRVPAPQERQQARLGHRAEERPRRHFADQGMSLPPAGRTVHWRHASRGHQLR